MWTRLRQIFRWPSLVICALLCVTTWILVEALTDSLLGAVPLSLGVGLLYLQIQAGQVVRSSESERDEALPLLQAALPKLRIGAPLDAAFILAADESANPTARKVAAYCARARHGLEAAQADLDAGVMARTVIAMIRAARTNGGEVAKPFESLAGMIETDQRLRRKQQIATLHVRAQANALVAIAVIILGLALFGNQTSLSFLRETAEGRLMVLFAATMMLWGYLVIAILTARIARV